MKSFPTQEDPRSPVRKMKAMEVTNPRPKISKPKAAS